MIRYMSAIAIASFASIGQAQEVQDTEIVISQEDDTVVVITNKEPRFIVDADGNVGVGTQDPLFRLEIEGTSVDGRTIGINGMPAVYIPDQEIFPGSIALGNGLRSSTNNSSAHGDGNTAIGMDALVNNTTHYYQTAVGAKALANSGGFGNTAVGFHTMVVNHTGFDNTAVGALSLLNNTTGFDNVAVGIKSMQSNQSGSENVALGGDALMYTIASQRNVAVGTMAGRFLADIMTQKTGGSESIYLGYLSSGGALDNASNEVVIGSRAVGAGSNSVTLGNDAITKTILKGKIGIGTKEPDYDLVVKGKNGFQVSDEAASTRLLLYTQSNLNRAVIQTNTGRNLAFIVNGGTLEAARFDPRGNFGLGATAFGSSASRVFAIGNGVAPASSPPNMVQLFARDTGMTSTLWVRDEAGNVTSLTPHNFSLIEGGASEDMAWAYYSERGGTAINVDMLRVIRVVETLSGESLVHVGSAGAAPFSAQAALAKDAGLASPVATYMAMSDTVAGVPTSPEGYGQGYASGEGAVAIAVGAEASGARSVAIGANSVATLSDSVAIGTGAATTAANQVALGGSGSSVRLGDVAASTEAQTGSVAIATVDSSGTIGQDTNMIPAFQSLQAVSAVHSDHLRDLISGQSALSGRVDTLYDLRDADRREMRAGIAAAIAVGDAPMPSAPGRTTYVLNGSTFRGQHAIGGSILHRIRAGKPFAIGGGFSAAGGKNTAVRIGIAGEF